MEKVLTVHSYDNYSKTIVITKYGVLQIIVLKLYSYIDSEVGNLRKFKFFTTFIYIRVTREIQLN